MDNVDIALTIIRLAVGLTFAAHGAQKAFGWWSGSGLSRWEATVSQMGFRPASLFAAVSVAAELGGGLLLAAGLLTPVVAAVLVAQTVVIIGRVHWPHGFFNTASGFEYPLLLGVGAAAVALAGPGTIAVDALVGVRIDPAPTVALLLGGFVAGLVALAVPSLEQRAMTSHHEPRT